MVVAVLCLSTDITELGIPDILVSLVVVLEPAAWLIATGRVEEEVTGDVVSEPVANVEDVPDVVVVVAVEVEDGIEECCDDEEAVTLVLGACCESKDGPVVAGALTFTLSPNLAPPSKVTFDTS